MEIFLVGGAVRDTLMGEPVKDRDWLVVGATRAEMLMGGYVEVGDDFPVFLHPETREEYALARAARNQRAQESIEDLSAPGVTLEEDLSRRDLTMNAMAQRARKSEDVAYGQLVDPYGGADDIRDRVFRHVGDSFAEDPIRILRLARFAARYADFTVAPETLVLMRRMVEQGAVDALVPDRVWKEVSRGLLEKTPSRMLQVLRECGALARLLPEVDRLYGVAQPAQWHPEIDTGIHIEMVLDYAAKINAPLAVRFAGLVHDLGKELTPKDKLPSHHGHEASGVPLVEAVCKRFKVPNECAELAVVVTQEHGNIHASGGLRATALMRLLERCDAIRRPDRFRMALLACDCDAKGRLGLESRVYPQRDVLGGVLDVAMRIDMRAVSAAAIARGKKGPDIGIEIRRARIGALEKYYNADKETGMRPNRPT